MKVLCRSCGEVADRESLGTTHAACPRCGGQHLCPLDSLPVAVADVARLVDAAVRWARAREVAPYSNAARLLHSRADRELLAAVRAVRPVTPP